MLWHILHANYCQMFYKYAYKLWLKPALIKYEH